MPDWLIEILRQFPIVVVIGFVAWYAAKQTAEKEIRLESRYDKVVSEAALREDKFRAEARLDRDAEIKRFQEAQKANTETNDKLLTAKDEQIASLTKEVAKLSKRLDELLKQLGGK